MTQSTSAGACRGWAARGREASLGDNARVLQRECDGFTGVQVSQIQLIKLYTVDGSSLSYANYTFIKFIFKTYKGEPVQFVANR